LITFRPAKRENTPLIIGIAGPTKSGKTYSALRLATGLAGGGPIAMLNAEGARGHQYADTFKYIACELEAPFRPDQYTDALDAVAKLSPPPAVVIIDSASHMHDGPGGILEWHEEILDKMAGQDYAKRQRSTFTAWVQPKQSENIFIYQMLSMQIPVILCLRAKEKIKIVKGQEPVDLGWQPIVGERVAFETMFTLMLPPHAKGVPDLNLSDMRSPFDTLIKPGQAIDESLGQALSTWAKGGTTDRLPAASLSGPVASPGATSGGGTGGTPTDPPSELEILCHDFKERFDEVQTVAEGKGWSERWEEAKVKQKIPPAFAAPVEAARNAARARLKRG